MKAKKDNGSGQTKNGIVKEFFKDGTLSCAGRHRDGTKIGERKYYLRNGALKAVGKYADGKIERAVEMVSRNRQADADRFV